MTRDEAIRIVETERYKTKIKTLEALLSGAREYVYEHWYEHYIDNEENRRTATLLNAIDDELRP